MSFADGDALLVSGRPYGFGIYVIGDGASLAEGTALVRLLRWRTAAALVVWRVRAPCAVWLDAGADMWLGKSATEADLAAAVRALRRRLHREQASTLEPPPWRLDPVQSVLWTPNAVPVPVSDQDVRLLRCFVGTNQATVPAQVLRSQLGTTYTENWLHASIYRLRRRIERAGSTALPLSAVHGAGYSFTAGIVLV